VQAGSSDLRAAAAALRSRLPAPLGALADIAYNYRWSWTPGGPELFESVDPRRWELCLGNPVRLIEEVHPDRWRRLAGDQDFLTRLGTLERSVSERLGEPLLTEPVTADNPAAFFCAEFAIHKSLPVYSGGLGVLAGDILKEASDMGLPMIGIGLMYRHGYFRQRIDASGWQHEYWVETDPDRVPAALVTGDDGSPVTVTVPIADREVVAQIWRVDVGRVPLLLLDCNRDENHLTDRWITSRLYVGDPGMRLGQYAVLGIGGMRALQALGVDPGVVHLNEGHAAMACLEAVRAESAGDIDDAFEAVRRKTVFTTHTPVPAGNETFDAPLVRRYLEPWRKVPGLDLERTLALGRALGAGPDDPFNLTVLALRTSREVNGVSQLHGRVAGEMWNAVLAERGPDRHVGSITNGVHVPTWLGRDMRGVLGRYLGPGFEQPLLDIDFETALAAVPDRELWEAHVRQKQRLVRLLRERALEQYARHGRSPDELRALGTLLDPQVLLVGFARRFATYKRADLLLRDFDRLRDIVSNDERPVQLLFAGKAHPADRPGQELIQRIWQAANRLELKGRLLLLENYDMGVARLMVQGVDVWLNNPRRPLEASGTSGMKAALNGGLNCSVLDGWWCEGYDPAHGWKIGEAEDTPDHEQQDRGDADMLYRVLREEIVSCYYERDEGGLPLAWIRRMKAAMGRLTPRFSASRMVREYTERYYLKY
jgi:glycogen phosphorylase